jgi:hypothetical protein
MAEVLYSAHTLSWDHFSDVIFPPLVISISTAFDSLNDWLPMEITIITANSNSSVFVAQTPRVRDRSTASPRHCFSSASAILLYLIILTICAPSASIQLTFQAPFWVPTHLWYSKANSAHFLILVGDPTLTIFFFLFFQKLTYPINLTCFRCIFFEILR